mmetsp:Transcript_8172/g.16428  ORF Transcript_8172/g.16428 Transcript_8172/m.16428 type:complete len:97 (-) Transcript_8172:339-629(-)
MFEEDMFSRRSFFRCKWCEYQKDFWKAKFMKEDEWIDGCAFYCTCNCAGGKGEAVDDDDAVVACLFAFSSSLWLIDPKRTHNGNYTVSNFSKDRGR